MDVGMGAGGLGPSRDFENFGKNDCFLSFEWEDWDHHVGSLLEWLSHVDVRKQRKKTHNDNLNVYPKIVFYREQLAQEKC